MWRLSDDDGRMVDLLLNAGVDNARPGNGHSNGGGDGSLTGVAAAPVAPQRFQALEKLLSALEHLPATEPPSDLVRLTLQRIAASAPWEGATPMAEDRPAPPEGERDLAEPA